MSSKTLSVVLDLRIHQAAVAVGVGVQVNRLLAAQDCLAFAVDDASDFVYVSVLELSFLLDVVDVIDAQVLSILVRLALVHLRRNLR